MTIVEGEVVGLYFKSVDSDEITTGNFLTFDKPGIFGSGGRMDVRASHFFPTRLEDFNPLRFIDRRSTTQWCAVSFEELERLAQVKDFRNTLELIPHLRVFIKERRIEAGINVCIKGMSGLTELPRGTRLTFSNERFSNDQIPGPVILGVEEHEEILLDGEEVLRGIAGVVHQTGKIAIGAKVTAEIPVLSA
ncbi:MAG: hypothetical protein Q8P92_00595 [Candidatus Daviesbacteria bacterium]|nr:hypothetical protein [Candidatus Daviesbacteria bacterium]